MGETTALPYSALHISAPLAVHHGGDHGGASTFAAGEKALNVLGLENLGVPGDADGGVGAAFDAEDNDFRGDVALHGPFEVHETAAEAGFKL